MKSLIFLLSLSFLSLFGVESPPNKSDIDILYEKLLAENIKESEKTYVAYKKSIDVATGKIIKALETTKIDLNDIKKGKMTIQERSKSIEEIDSKIKELKSGNLNEVVISLFSPKSTVSPIVGNWQRNSEFYTLTTDNRVVNPWNENWKWEVDSENKITIYRIGTPNIIKYVVTLKKNQLIGKLFDKSVEVDVIFDRVK